MSFWFFVAAGVLSGVWFVVHLIAGGRDIAQPVLQASELDPVVRETMYLCWHFTSVAIACITGFFLWSAMTGTETLAAAGAILASGLAVVGIGLVVLRKSKHLELPQGWLFVPVALIGLAGLVA